jgi:MFS family permease
MLPSSLPLLDATQARFQLTPWRWFVLFYFSVSNCNQCLAWFSFSSTDEEMMRGYFGDRLSTRELDLLLNWGPIVGAACFPLSTWTMQQSSGLKKAIWWGIALCFAGNLVRCIPMMAVVCGGSPAFVRSTTAFALYHSGQILIAAAGPFQMGATSRLACVWFGEHERTTATAIASTANAVGTTIGFLNPLWLARTSQAIPNIFWLSLAAQVVPLVCALAYLPAAPQTPPSAAAAATPEVFKIAEASGATSSSSSSSSSSLRPTWLQSIGRAGASCSFILLICMAAVLSGINAGWQALFQSVLAPAIGRSSVGWVGFGNAVAGNIGAVLSGLVIDRFLRRRLKLGILLGVTGAFVSVTWFTMQLPCLTGWDSPPPPELPPAAAPGMPPPPSSPPSPPLPSLLPRSEATLVTAVSLVGFFYGVTTPLFYEFGAELIYPVKEGMSAGLLVLIWNLSSAVIILLNGYSPPSDMNFIMAVTFGCVFLVILCCVRERYHRPLNEARAKAVDADTVDPLNVRPLA